MNDIDAVGWGSYPSSRLRRGACAAAGGRAMGEGGRSFGLGDAIVVALAVTAAGVLLIPTVEHVDNFENVR